MTENRNSNSSQTRTNQNKTQAKHPSSTTKKPN